jgi:hypothetical protein
LFCIKYFHSILLPLLGIIGGESPDSLQLLAEMLDDFGMLFPNVVCLERILGYIKKLAEFRAVGGNIFRVLSAIFI